MDGRTRKTFWFGVGENWDSGVGSKGTSQQVAGELKIVLKREWVSVGVIICFLPYGMMFCSDRAQKWSLLGFKVLSWLAISANRLSPMLAAILHMVEWSGDSVS